MSRPLIPKEMQSAYQRWELTSFGEEAKVIAPAIPTPTPAASMVSAETVANIHEAARQSGYAAGLAQGKHEGYEAGLAQASSMVNEQAASLRQLAENFGHEVARTDELIAQDLLTLALDISKAMLVSALQVRPELVIPVIREAIGYLPTVQRPATLVLNPEDAMLVRQHMESELIVSGWAIQEDSRLERGGCCIETASNEINASAVSRWQRIANALGKDGNWLEP